MNVAVLSVSDDVGQVSDPSGGESWLDACERSVASEDASLPASSRDDLMQCNGYFVTVAARECRNGPNGEHSSMLGRI